jgi:hypothetical protein
VQDWSNVPKRLRRVLAFRATLGVDSPLIPKPAGKVVRTIAIRDDQTLEQLHEALRLAFGWDDPHLYCFWLSGKFWDRDSVRYSAPFELDDDELSARTPISEVGLGKGARIAYLFDYGDEWRLLLDITDDWPAGDESYPMLVEAEGTPPPQYQPLDEDDD